MSYYDKNTQKDWRLRSNGLNKSSSQPKYFFKKDLELDNYNKNYLPLIKLNQQADIYSKQIDKSNKIKDEILNSKYKYLKNRGIDNNAKNKYHDSWTNFFKRKEREKQRRKMYKILQDKSFNSTEEENNADDIFRNGYSKLSKIEDKIKLKRYLPVKRDLTKLMMKINNNINDRVDLNNYLLSKNIRNLENGYDDLREMLENKMNKMEKKQEEDFYDLRKYFKRRAKWEDDDKFNNNFQNYNNNEENNYFKPNMKENIEKLQIYEIAKKIQNIPNLLDNFIQNIEGIRQLRQQEKNEFLIDFNNSLRGYNNPIYENIDFDYNLKYNDYKYPQGHYFGMYDDISDFSNSFLNGNNFNSYRYSKPKSETIKRHLGKNYLSMSQSEIDKLRKNLKPISFQNKNDNKDFLFSGDELLEIYRQRNKNKNMKYNTNNMNIQENQVVNKLKQDKEEKNKETDDVVVVDSEKDKKKNDNNDKKEESKKSESDSDSDEESKKQENKNEKKEEEKSDSDNDESDEESDEDDDNNGNKDGK